MTGGIKAGKSSCKKRESRHAKSAKRELTGRQRSPIRFFNYWEPELLILLSDPIREILAWYGSDCWSRLLFQGICFSLIELNLRALHLKEVWENRQ